MQALFRAGSFVNKQGCVSQTFTNWVIFGFSKAPTRWWRHLLFVSATTYPCWLLSEL